MLLVLITVLHVTVSVILILVVLLQQGGKGDLGVFGGASTQTAFGGAGPATVLHKITVGAAALFMITCIYLSLNPTRQSVDTDVTKKLPAAQPAKPTPPPAPTPGTPAPGTPQQGTAPTPATPESGGGTPKEQGGAPNSSSATPAPAAQPAGSGGSSAAPKKQ